MGYNSRLYIVSKSSGFPHLIGDKELQYAEVIATCEACKFPELRNAFTQPTDCFIYDTDGNTRIIEDDYGKPLTELPIVEVMKVLNEQCAIAERDGTILYRRIKPLLYMLSGFNSTNGWKDFDNLAVLHYGH